MLSSNSVIWQSAACCFFVHVKEAVKWWRKAAEQNHAPAQCDLGIAYAFGEGIAKDAEEAVTWYRKAAVQGDELAQNNLAVCYLSRRTSKDYTDAASWLRKAAAQRYGVSQYNLAVCYARGYGLKPKMQQALAWFRKAAISGDTDVSVLAQRFLERYSRANDAERRQLVDALILHSGDHEGKLKR